MRFGRWSMPAAAGVLVVFLGACAQTPTSPSATPSGTTIGVAPQMSAPVPPRLTVTPPRTVGVRRFLAFGDSLTWGAQSSFDPRFLFAADNGGYPERLQAGLNFYLRPTGFVVVNAGVPGEWASASDTLTRFRNQLSTVKPGAVLLLEGINDLNNDQGVSATVTGLRRMVDAATSAGIPVLIATMFQTYESTDPNGVVRHNAASLVPSFNSAIRSTFSGRLNVHIVDLESQMTDRSLIGNDGLHLTDAGYARMAAIFLAAIESAFPVRGSFQ